MKTELFIIYQLERVMVPTKLNKLICDISTDNKANHVF